VSWLRRLVASLSARKPGFNPVSVCVKFVVDKLTLGLVFLRVLGFPSFSIISPVLVKRWINELSSSSSSSSVLCYSRKLLWPILSCDVFWCAVGKCEPPEAQLILVGIHRRLNMMFYWILQKPFSKRNDVPKGHCLLPIGNVYPYGITPYHEATFYSTSDLLWICSQNIGSWNFFARFVLPSYGVKLISLYSQEQWFA
jgi:hypothetical protein